MVVLVARRLLTLQNCDFFPFEKYMEETDRRKRLNADMRIRAMPWHYLVRITITKSTPHFDRAMTSVEEGASSIVLGPSGSGGSQYSTRKAELARMRETEELEGETEKTVEVEEPAGSHSSTAEASTNAAMTPSRRRPHSRSKGRLFANGAKTNFRFRILPVFLHVSLSVCQFFCLPNRGEKKLDL